MHGKPNDYLATTEEVAQYLHKDERTIVRWRSLRQGPPFMKAGHNVLYRKGDVDAWLAASRVMPVRENACG